MTEDVQRANIRVAATALAPVAEHHQLVLSHGNGPQVGLLALQAAAYKDVEPYPLDVLGAQTEGMIGYLIEQELGNALPAEVPLATLLTMIEVDADDPAFADPTKFVGPIYDDAVRRGTRRAEGVGLQARRRPPPPRRGLTGTEADLRDPPDPLAARPGRRRDLRRRRGHPHRVDARRERTLRGDRGGDRQGLRQRDARPGDRRRPVRDGDRRRRRLRRVGHRRRNERSAR